MKLNQQDKIKIFAVLAEKYFNENGWKYYKVADNVEKIQKICDDINRQHAAYPSITRDWYVQNGGAKGIHLCDTWDELKTVCDFLKIGAVWFDFFVDTGEIKAFCILSATKELAPERIDIILKAQAAGIRTLVFLADVPNEIDANVLQIKKSEC
ncbi:hypothetical protein [Methanolapillus millepedarum]|uniref:Uncharacterized protein n=1 Tax=Methanolapillus millepedarum TaxID=3028296 RepID=A0AA96V274_9EURY|nr:hypothetical protein MsAc7_05870 [Methanosarcinaceae archaeon Ac7]